MESGPGTRPTSRAPIPRRALPSRVQCDRRQAPLCRHLSRESRSALIVDAELGESDGRADRETAKQMLAHQPKTARQRVPGAVWDKHNAAFGAEVRPFNVTSHGAQNTIDKRDAVGSRSTRRVGHELPVANVRRLLQLRCRRPSGLALDREPLRRVHTTRRAALRERLVPAGRADKEVAGDGISLDPSPRAGGLVRLSRRTPRAPRAREDPPATRRSPQGPVTGVVWRRVERGRLLVETLAPPRRTVALGLADHLATALAPASQLHVADRTAVTGVTRVAAKDLPRVARIARITRRAHRCPNGTDGVAALKGGRAALTQSSLIATPPRGGRRDAPAVGPPPRPRPASSPRARRLTAERGAPERRRADKLRAEADDPVAQGARVEELVSLTVEEPAINERLDGPRVEAARLLYFRDARREQAAA